MKKICEQYDMIETEREANAMDTGDPGQRNNKMPASAVHSVCRQG